MKWSTLTLLSLLDFTLAGKWRIVGHPLTLLKYNGNRQITNAVKQAFLLARTAIEVLDAHRNDPPVQSMLNHILRNDLVEQETDIRRAKEYYAKVLRYDAEESTEPLISFNSDQDLLIYIDKSGYEVRPDNRLWIISQNLPQLTDNAQTAMDCYNLKPEDTPDGSLPQALTTRPNAYHPEYFRRREQWTKDKAAGLDVDENPPDSFGMFVAQTDKPNHMDIATWFLDQVIDPKSHAMATFDAAFLEKFDDDEFMWEFTDKGNILAIDALTADLSLPGMLLHELTHTTLGGMSYEVPADSSGDSYGHEAIGEVKAIDNADSLAMLAICMWLYKNGFWVDQEGNILRV
ncbi:hypothetical protein QBC34DRAFT_469830 [Podospora aff. communis PSN243]|uniref:Uncharacterized protein n=1 Tax=Podospora aff. communis PSN243 TaxID=3040156 RepID=A0AAV9GGA8_9PEZI|nr:hypothetical protein QBC34DRAFT_469830 [Podospora aff. communis PSN243]